MVNMSLFTFGIITDIQYADFDNGMDYTQTKTRYYRDSLKQVKAATKSWNDIDQLEGRPVDFVLQLGDIIDGKNSRCTPQVGSLALSRVMESLSEYQGKYHHAIGNHELYNFTREQILQTPLNSGDATDGAELYYSFSPSRGFRFVIVDTYDVSVLGHGDTSSPRYIEARNLLFRHNQNEDKNEPYGEEGSLSRRFVKYSGGVSEKQLRWLDGVLAEACRNGERVVVAGHAPVSLGSSDIEDVCWNYQEVLDVLHKHDCVLAYFAGHQHDGAYSVDDRGIHHVTFDAVVETSPETVCYATAHVYRDKIDIKGFGQMPDRHITL